MLNRDGSFSFTEELMALVDDFMAEYEGAKGTLRNDLERGLVISYVLGVMLCDLELLWEALGASPVFGRLNPRAIFEECARQNAARSEARRQVEQELEQRGWLPQQEAKGEAAMEDGSDPAEV